MLISTRRHNFSFWPEPRKNLIKMVLFIAKRAYFNPENHDRVLSFPKGAKIECDPSKVIEGNWYMGTCNGGKGYISKHVLRDCLEEEETAALAAQFYDPFDTHYENGTSNQEHGQVNSGEPHIVAETIGHPETNVHTAESSNGMSGRTNGRTASNDDAIKENIRQGRIQASHTLWSKPTGALTPTSTLPRGQKG